MRTICLAAAAGFLAASVLHASELIPVEHFARFAEFEQAEISPDGKHVALSVPTGDQTGLVILDITNHPQMKLAGGFKLGENEHVHTILWANNGRVLFSTAQLFGAGFRPWSTGRLYGVDINGKNLEMHVGTDDRLDFYTTWFDVLDLLPDEPSWILVSNTAYDRDRPIVEKLNIEPNRPGLVRTGGNMNTRQIGRSPLNGGGLLTDSKGAPRFAYNFTDQMKLELAYREKEAGEWQRVEPPASMGNRWEFLSFDEDDASIVFWNNKPDAMGIYRLDPVSGSATAIAVSSAADGLEMIEEPLSTRVAGAVFEDGKPENRFIDEQGETARLYRMLEQAFKGLKVTITSSSRDGRRALVKVEGDRLPPDFYLFDTQTKKVQFLLSSRKWLDPNRMAKREPIHFKASDGREIPGYLTLPLGKEPKGLPMVVMVHGGPHGVRDHWQFDNDAQLLANRGYAVLQVNYRGSGGYGAEFERAGYGKWGTRIQDDILDGAQWAVKEGIAASDRICIYGASFGGYSVMQSLIRHPEFYQCGLAFAGVYDLPLMLKQEDHYRTQFAFNFWKSVMATDPAEQQAQSPAFNAEKIKSAVFLAHGREDTVAHVDQYHRMKNALEKAGVDHETLLVPREGHGFYKLENRVKLYEDMLAFFEKHIGE